MVRPCVWPRVALYLIRTVLKNFVVNLRSIRTCDFESEVTVVWHFRDIYLSKCKFGMGYRGLTPSWSFSGPSVHKKLTAATNRSTRLSDHTRSCVYDVHVGL